MPDARHYIVHAEEHLTLVVDERLKNDEANEMYPMLHTDREIKLALDIANAKSLALIAEHLAPQVTNYAEPETDHGMAICTLRGSHDTNQTHALIECPTYGAPASDPWAQARSVDDTH